MASTIVKQLQVVVTFALTVERAASHGSMNVPPTRASQGKAFEAADPASCFLTDPGACLWYNVGCMSGCDECSLEGKILYIEPSDVGCAAPTEPAIPEYARSWNIGNPSWAGDWTKYNPWRAPGSAPVADPCGLASGYDGGGWDLPAGYTYMDKGTDLPPLNGTRTVWKAGGTAEVSYAIWASHGGGVQYRLCPADEQPTEECFQRTPLPFATNASKIRYTDGATADVAVAAVDVSEGTLPAGSAWRRMPVPACNCDIGTGCSSLPKAEGTMSEAYARDADAKATTPNCPTGTQFPPPAEGIYGVGGYQCTGGSTGKVPAPGACAYNFEWSIVDEVAVPDTAGRYVLQWRWDAEQTAQVWNTCADVEIE
jgi:hypothetical protein